MSHLPILVCATKSSSRCLVHDKRPFTVLICRILHFALLTAAWEFFKRIFPAGFSRWAEKFPVIMHETKEHCDSLLPRWLSIFPFFMSRRKFLQLKYINVSHENFLGKILGEENWPVVKKGKSEDVKEKILLNILRKILEQNCDVW